MENIHELIPLITEEDKSALILLYELRCLNPEQLFQKCYTHVYETRGDFVKQTLTKFASLELVEVTEYRPKSYGVTLKTMGVNVVRFFLDLEDNIITKEKRVLHRGFYRASDLKVLPRHMNHQIHLNEFLIQFETQFRAKYPHQIYHYKDEKHLSHFLQVRPDGLLQVLDMDIFLEMDLNTETRKHLLKKWEHYRRFLMSNEFALSERPILILFICEQTDQLSRRVQLVRETAFEIMGEHFSERFDLAVGSAHTLFKDLFSYFIPKWRGEANATAFLKQSLQQRFKFQLLPTQPLQTHVTHGCYHGYLKRILQDSLPNQSPKTQDFLLLDARVQLLSAWTTIDFHATNNPLFKEKVGQEFPLIVVVNNEAEALEFYRNLTFSNHQFVLFTTKERLSRQSFPHALFQFTPSEERFHFLDERLSLKSPFESNN